GHSVIKMADLRERLASLGVDDVTTYIQSGNVLFSSPETNSEKVTAAIESALRAALGQPVTAFVKTRAELELAAAANPFELAERDPEQVCHLVFLSAEPDPKRKQALMALQGDEYRFAVRDKVLYWAYSRSIAGNRRNINVESVLGVTATARTWKVIDALIR